MFSEWVHERYPHLKVTYAEQKWMGAIGDGECLRFLQKSDSLLGKLLVVYFQERDYAKKKGLSKCWYWLTMKVRLFQLRYGM